MNGTFRSGLICLSILLLVWTPDSHSSQEYSESVSVDLVDLYVTATDQKGRFITDLRGKDLRIEEDGVTQNIQRFGLFTREQNDVPMLLVLMLDNSVSMNEQMDGLRKLDLAKQAASRLLAQLRPVDRVMFVSFNETYSIRSFSSDKVAIETDLYRLRPTNRQTAFFDSLDATLRELRSHPGRKILFLCTDAQDNRSKTSLEGVVEMAALMPELTIAVLGTVVSDPRPGLAYISYSSAFGHGKETLQLLADRTAGYAYFPETKKAAERDLNLIGDFIRSQYFLAYRSGNSRLDGSWRAIRIYCDRIGVSLNYRKGYYAVDTTPIEYPQP